MTSEHDPARSRQGLDISGQDARSVSADRASATRRIAASAHAIFRLVSDPARHVDIDGTGMLQAAPDVKQLAEVGQTFDMDMDRRPLGDIPNMAEYKVRCTVTRLVPDRLVEWSVAVVGQAPAGHVWGWEIDPDGESASEVINYCDWSNVSDEVRASYAKRSGGRAWPVVPADQLLRSLDNLERIATRVVE